MSLITFMLKQEAALCRVAMCPGIFNMTMYAAILCLLQTQVMLQRFKACVLYNTVALGLRAEAWKFGNAYDCHLDQWSCLPFFTSPNKMLDVCLDFIDPSDCHVNDKLAQFCKQP